MIRFLKGEVFAIDKDHLILDVNQIGYSIIIAPSLFEKTPQKGESVFLHTHLQVKDDGWQLFGFPAEEQLHLFQKLLSVSGIGAKIAMGMLNHTRASHLVNAILQGDEKTLSANPGIGKKSAQRIILELKDKLENFDYFAGDQPVQGKVKSLTPETLELMTALQQLGYSSQETQMAADFVMQENNVQLSVEKKIKEALRFLMRS